MLPKSPRLKPRKKRSRDGPSSWKKSWHSQGSIFAPRSEKQFYRIFNEAEEATDDDDADSEESDLVALPDTGLPAVEGTAGTKRGRRPLPEDLPRERVCPASLPDSAKNFGDGGLEALVRIGEPRHDRLCFRQFFRSSNLRRERMHCQILRSDRPRRYDRSDETTLCW